MTQSMLDNALKYAGIGWHVFPLWPGKKEPRIAKVDGGQGAYDGTTDHGQIYEWWTRWPDANIGVHCGPSGFFAIDEDAEDILWGDVDGFSRDTVTNLTARGTHLLYEQPKDVRIGNAEGSTPAHVNVKGWGGYILVWPSVHPDGPVYRWEDSYSPFDLDPIPAPVDLIKAVTRADSVTVSITIEAGVETPDVNALALDPSIRYDIFNPAPKGLRSEQDARVIWALIHHAMLTPSQVVALYDAYPVGTRSKYADRGLSYLERTIKNAYSFRPREKDQTETQRQARETVAGLRYAVTAYTWPGTKPARAARARTLMIAILNIADRTGKAILDLSHRQLAKESGLSPRTAGRILKDGILSPFLMAVPLEGRKKPGSDGFRPSKYALIGAVDVSGSEIARVLTHTYTHPYVSSMGQNARYYSENDPLPAGGQDLGQIRPFESQYMEIARQITALLGDDAFVRNYVPPEKKRDLTRVYVKSFTSTGRDIIAYLVAMGGQCLLSDLVSFCGVHRNTINAAIDRMSDNLTGIGVDPIVTRGKDTKDRRRVVAILDPDWHARLHEARPHLYTDGLVAKRRRWYALEQAKHAAAVHRHTRIEGTRETAAVYVETAKEAYRIETGRELTVNLDG